MTKIKFECDGNIDQGTINELFELAAKKQISCKYETRAAVKAKVESGAAKSEYDAEKQVAEETGEKLATVHKRNQRAKKEEVGTKNKNVPTAEPETAEDWPDGDPEWTCAECDQTWTMDVEECSCQVMHNDMVEKANLSPQNIWYRPEVYRDIIVNNLAKIREEAEAIDCLLEIIKLCEVKISNIKKGGNHAN